MSTVKVVMTGHGRGEVFIDGVKVKNCKSVKVSCAVNTVNLVTIDVQPEKIELEGIANISGMEDSEYHRFEKLQS